MCFTSQTETKQLVFFHFSSRRITLTVTDDANFKTTETQTNLKSNQIIYRS